MGAGAGLPRDLGLALRAAFGETRVVTDPDALITYECDGLTLARHAPGAVVFPESTREVQQAVRLCAQHDVPFLARGAGTGLSGGAVAAAGGVIIEMARLNAIVSIDEANRVAVVQAGLVNLHLSNATRPRGLFYAPDPSSQGACTIGGNVAENSGGPHTLKYGVTTNHVLGLTLVMPDGSLLHTGSISGASPGFDLTGLIVGSEGTFGIVTEVTLRLMRVPQAVRTFLGVFETVEGASETVSAIIRAGIVPAALELMDNLAIRAVQAHLKAGFPVDAGAVLLIEIEGHAVELDAMATAIAAACRDHGSRSVIEAHDEATRQRLWRGRKQALGAIGKISRAYYTHDGVVPRAKLPLALARIAEIGARHRIRIANVCHAGDGNLHPLCLFDPDDADEAERAHRAGEEILAVCIELGGTLTGEHGIGLEKRALMPLLFSADDLDQMSRVRRAFDPHLRCNPGKLFPSGAKCGEMVAARAARSGGWV